MERKEIEAKEAAELLAKQIFINIQHDNSKHLFAKKNIKCLTKSILMGEEAVKRTSAKLFTIKISKDPLHVKNKISMKEKEYDIIKYLDEYITQLDVLKNLMSKRLNVLNSDIMKEKFNKQTLQEIKQKCIKDFEWLLENYNCEFRKSFNPEHSKENPIAIYIFFTTKQDSILYSLDGDKYNFGKFYIELSISLDSDLDFKVKADPIDPNYNALKINYHPHISNQDQVCLGEGASIIKFCLNSLEINQIPEIIETILNTYNPESPYCSLEDWNKIGCGDCSQHIEEIEGSHCCVCGHFFCSDCLNNGYCSDCKPEEEEPEEEEPEELEAFRFQCRIEEGTCLNIVCVDCKSIVATDDLFRCKLTQQFACENCMVPEPNTGYLVRKIAIENEKEE